LLYKNFTPLHSGYIWKRVGESVIEEIFFKWKFFSKGEKTKLYTAQPYTYVKATIKFKFL
jgi:hypothetical protein